MNTLAGTIWALLTAAIGFPFQGSSSIKNTKHNLSVSGPGPYKAATEERICIFCHAPHRARTQFPLWNREDSRSTYLTYSSSTFKGTVSQPNGSTKLCLSCHDGTIALGKVVSLSTEIAMSGSRFLDTGRAHIGTNLKDDHPVSFDYSTSKGGTGLGYRLPSAITPPVRLDYNGFVQCTSCHDAHDDSLGHFLRATDRNGDLCLSCHDPKDWATSSHATSTATWNGSGADPWPYTPYTTVKENACADCHVPHAAGTPERLLKFTPEEENCLRCHNGNVASKNIAADLTKISAHNPASWTGVHDPAEDPLTMPRHAECQDCHNPHTAKSGTAQAPGVPGPLYGVSGLNNAGQKVDAISFGYELCYKCHADKNGGQAFVPRVIQQTNVRLEFNPANPSYHPIEAQGKNTFVPSLIPPWTTSSVLACTDCHQSDSSPDAGGNGPRGPHGSQYRPLLILNYNTQDNVTESAQQYALCYKCHSRTSILSNQSFKEHKKHIQGEKAPCSACHDAHGISSTQGTSTNNTHLINFRTDIVQPSKKNGRLEFIDGGLRKGTCSLLCHGKDHDRKSY